MIAQVIPILLAFGANLGSREKTITAAAQKISAHPKVTDFKLSPFKETIAFGVNGPDPEAPKYLNAVATAVTTLDPHELLDFMQRIENDFGRTRKTKWGDRTLDIDLILFGGRVIKDERLTVPHPHAHERDFVLSPWLALDPAAVLMGHGRVTELLQRIGDTTKPYYGEQNE